MELPDKVHLLEEQVTELTKQLAQIRLYPTRLRITVRAKTGRPKFFFLNPAEDFRQTVERMNKELGTTDYTPYDRYYTEYTNLSDFRPDDTVFLSQSTVPAQLYTVYSRKGVVLQENATIESVRQYEEDHKSEGPFRVRAISPVASGPNVVKKLAMFDQSQRPEVFVELMGRELPFTVDTGASRSTITLAYKALLAPDTELPDESEWIDISVVGGEKSYPGLPLTANLPNNSSVNLEILITDDTECLLGMDYLKHCYLAMYGSVEEVFIHIYHYLLLRKTVL